MFCLSELAGGTPRCNAKEASLTLCSMEDGVTVIRVNTKFTSAPRAICNITAPLDQKDAFVDCLGGCLVSLHRKSEVGLGGRKEEGFVLRSLKLLAELLDLSALPSCYGVATAFLALSRSRLFLFLAFCCLSLASRVFRACLAVT